MLLKRAARGRLDLFSISEAPVEGADEESRLVKSAKQIALAAIRLAREKFGDEVQKQQEVLMSIADIVMEIFAMESSLLRSRKFSAGKGANAADMCAVLLRDALGRIETSARNVLGACLEGDALRTQLAALSQSAACVPLDGAALRRRIAGRLLERERYVV